MSNLVNLYTFDTNSVSGSDLKNMATGLFDASLNNSPTIDTVNFKVGNASLKLVEANSQYVNINNFSVTTDGLTIAFWFNFPNLINGKPVFNFSNGTTDIILYAPYEGAIMYNGSTLKLSGFGGGQAGIGWRHITWTMKYNGVGVNAQHMLYYNGDLSYNYSIFPYPNLGPRTQNYLGRTNLGTSYSTGNIDDFRIYNSVLSESEIKNIVFSNPCFKENTLILCQDPYTNECHYRPIETLKKGDLVKTLDGYCPIHIIGHKTIYNMGSKERLKDQLYRLSPQHYSGEVFEDLYLKGCHGILVPSLTEKQRERHLDSFDKVYVTDGHYRLFTCLDERAEPLMEKGYYKIYHLTLESEDPLVNYGIYANGLLVESCSLFSMKENSGMEFKE